MSRQTNRFQHGATRLFIKRTSKTARIVAAVAMTCGISSWMTGLGSVQAQPVQFAATVLPGSTNLVGRSSLNVTVTVTQLGDYSRAETHGLPSHLHFELTDQQHHHYVVTGVLQHPVQASGGNGYQYVGVYTVPIPNPPTALSNVTLKLDGFQMQDVGRKDDGDDDAVHGTQAVGLLAISPAPPNFSGSIVAAATSVVGKSSVDVTLTVTQNGDTEDSHSLPGQVQFRWFDAQNHAWTVTATLKSQTHNGASPGVTSQYAGVYSVPVPNPATTLTNVSLQANRFSMVDLNHGSDDDDWVNASVSTGIQSISPAPPNFSAAILPTSTNLTGNSKVDVSVTVSQNGDTEEGHTLPDKLQFHWVDAQNHQWSATGTLKTPVASAGGNGYKYVGDYVVSVPNPTQTLTNVSLKADGFTMLDANHRSEGDDHVDASQFTGPVTIAPAPPNFSATIVPSATGLVGNGSVDVTLTVTQAGDTEEGHSLPKQIKFDWVDASHHVVTVTGTLKSPVSSQGGVSYQYQGVYSVPIPSPQTPWLGVSLHNQPFHMMDGNHGGTADDLVAAAQYAGPFTINPAPPSFTASVIPSTSNVTGNSLLAVTVVVTQNGDVQENQIHALPKTLQFTFADNAQHRWDVTGNLASPVSARGAVGYQYQGVYLVRVPNPSSGLPNVNLTVAAFTMIDGNHGSQSDDAVAAAQAASVLTISPAK